jgi:hypothetical protein
MLTHAHENSASKEAQGLVIPWESNASLLDFAQLLDAKNWQALYKTERLDAFRLLDIGSQTTIFPRLLVKKQVATLPILYDYSNPSLQHLQTIRNSLPQPFVANRALQCTPKELAQAVRDEGAKYDIIWALHSLYSLDIVEIQSFIEALSKSLKALGKMFIAHASNDSFSYQMLQRVSQRESTAAARCLLSGEKLLEAIKESGLHVESRLMTSHHVVPRTYEKGLSSFLSQCSLSPRSYSEWFQDQRILTFLQEFEFDGYYLFPQKVWLIELGLVP